MSRVITAIKRTARDASRCSVFVNDEFLVACSIDIATSLGLKKGLELTEELEQKLRSNEGEMKLKQKAYHFATYKSRTRKQVVDFLTKKVEPGTWNVEPIIEWLESFGLINDLDFAKRFVDASHERKPLSKNAMRQKLATKGIPAAIIDEVLGSIHSEEDELNAAVAAAEKKLRTLKGDEKERNEKLVRFLMGKGYRWEIVKKALRQLGSKAVKAVLIVTALLPYCLTAQTLSCTKIRLPESINRFQPVTQPVLGPDGKLYIDRKKHPSNTDGPQDPDDVWVSSSLVNGHLSLVKQQWSEPEHFDAGAHAAPDVLFNFTTDGLHALLAGPYSTVRGVAKRVFAVASRHTITSPFTRVQRIEIPGVEALGKNYYGFLTDDLKTLVFAMELPGGKGDLDLYVTHECKGVWSKPEPLGPDINTAGFEGAPWLSPDGNTLYFSSNGRDDRRGKTDLYVATRDTIKRGTWNMEHGTWKRPRNLGACVNTIEEETSISLIGRGDTALITSWDAETDRLGIYMVVLTEDTRPQPWCKFTGKVVDAITSAKIVNAKVELIDSADTKQCGTQQFFVDTTTGTFSIALQQHKRYTVRTTAQFYVVHNQVIEIKSIDSTIGLRLTTQLFNKTKPLYSIYFERGDTVVTDEQRASIIEFAKKYDIRQLAFEVSGYTDNIGSIPFNQTLSSKRAESVRTILVESGIETKRVKATGRGIEFPNLFPELRENPQSRRVDVFAADLE